MFTYLSGCLLGWTMGWIFRGWAEEKRGPHPNQGPRADGERESNDG